MLTQPFSVPNHDKQHAYPRLDISQKMFVREAHLVKNYEIFKKLPTRLLKNQHLHQCLGQDEVLFYQLVQRHLKEILPVLYTPTVGEVVQTFNKTRKKARGLYIQWSDRARLEELLAPYKSSDIRIAVITDGERILGLGDQGVGGIEICTAKAMMYVICAGLAPHQLLPIYLDVGTNNPQLLEDPEYQGWRHARVSEPVYDDFIDQVVRALREKFPSIYLHWEDLGRDNANRVLKRYQKEFCTFNDDIQGTGVVTLASALNAIKITKIPLKEQRIIVFGGGTAGLGIADQLCSAMQRMGLTDKEARNNIWLIGRYGLLFTDSGNLTELQKPYARPQKERVHYASMNAHQEFDLLSVVEYVKPTFLIGCSGKAGAFTEEVITTMAKYTDRPIIFPLSNPTSYCEALPKDILRWTQNKALIATGSPFEDVMVEGKQWPISQCNNALAFPGIGLGVQASQTRQLTEDMLWKACLALCEATPESIDYPVLLPNMADIHGVSEKIADAIYQAVPVDQLAEKRVSSMDRIKHIRAQYWNPLQE